MSAGPVDRARPAKSGRDAATDGLRRRLPRELYDATPPSGPDSAGDRAVRDAAFVGEFEQRARGPEGTGQAGRFGSDQAIRDELCRRIAEDPRLAGTRVELAMDQHVLSLSGQIAGPDRRDLLLEHARALGIAEVRDSLQVEPADAGPPTSVRDVAGSLQGPSTSAASITALPGPAGRSRGRMP